MTGVIFAAAHNLGVNDFSEYDATQLGGGDLAINATAALAGTAYGMSVTVNDANPIYGQATFDTPYTTGLYRVRYYIYPNGFSLANPSQVVPLYLVNSSGTETIVVSKMTYHATTGYCIRNVIIDDDGIHRETNVFSITDESHYVELLFTRATGADANDATLETWIDSVAKTTLSGIKSFTRSAELKYVSFGHMSQSGTVSGTYYLDELVVRDDATEIGPVSNGPTLSVNIGPDTTRKTGVRIYP